MVLKRSFKGYKPVPTGQNRRSQGGILGEMRPPSALPEKRRRPPDRRVRGSGGSVTTGWVDPTGLEWDYAWDPSLADAATEGDIPAVRGDIDLTTSGAYSETAANELDGLSLTAYNLSRNQPVSVDTADFDASLPGLVASGPVHIRMVLKLGSTLGEILEIGAPSGRRIEITHDTTVGNISIVSRNASQVIAVSHTISVTSTGWLALDIVISDDDTNSQIQAWANSVASVSSSFTEVYPGITDGSVAVSAGSWDGDIGFLGIRRATLTTAQHEAFDDLVRVPLSSTRDFTEAFDFTGNDAYFTSDGAWDENALFDLKGSGNTQFSISVWVYQAGTGTTANPAGRNGYFGIGAPTTGAGSRNVGQWFAPRLSNGGQTGAGWPTTDGNNYYHGVTTTPSTGAWHHWLMVYDGSQATQGDRIRIWLDGVAQTLAWVGGTPPITYAVTSTRNFTVGADGDGNIPQAGAIKEMAVYSAVLGAADATEFYNSGSGVDHLTASNSADLEAYWRFNNTADTTSTISDQTANGRDLTAGAGDTPVLATV